MSALASSVSTFIDGLLYRGREGHLLYLGHRLAGLGTLLFLAIHIVDTSFAYFWPAGYGHALELYRNPVFMVGEILLVAAVIYHGVNGLKIILNDTFPQWWNKAPERGAFWRVAVITALLWAPAAFLMGRSLYWHSICRCAPETTVNVAAVTNFALVSIPVLFVVILGALIYGNPLQMAGGAARRVAVPARNLETYGWLFMRWSGALLIPLVWIHVLLQDVLVGVHTITIDYVALRWATLGWQVYDIALLAFAFAHGMNGLRAVAEDYIRRPGAIKVVQWLIFLGWLAITAVGAVAILRGVSG
jgi:succinate dehydrogenase cytochrome b556 subunit